VQIVQKLLIAAVADLDVGVRKSVFDSLDNNPTFDDFLAQADILTSIFVALNDEVNFNLQVSLFHATCLLL
jgi:serine/threonine-protein kinase mTOR